MAECAGKREGVAGHASRAHVAKVHFEARRESGAKFLAISEADVEAANRRMAERLERETRAVAACYDSERGRIVIELSTDEDISFPPDRLEGLEGAAAADLAEIEIGPAGLALHFPRLDADFALAPLLAGSFGSRNGPPALAIPHKI